MAEGYPFFSKRSKRLCSFSWRKKKEPKEHPPYQASPIWEDVIDYGQRPPSIKVLVWFTKLSSYGWIISSLLWKHRDGSWNERRLKDDVRCKMDDVRCKMGNPHIDSVERNGAGIFRVLNLHRKWHPPSRADAMAKLSYEKTFESANTVIPYRGLQSGKMRLR